MIFRLKQLLQDLKKLNDSNRFGVKITKERTRRRRQDKPKRIQPSNSCGICRDEIYSFEYNNGSGLYTPCHHLFHKSCLCQWLNRMSHNPTCPICRRRFTQTEYVSMCPPERPQSPPPEPEYQEVWVSRRRNTNNVPYPYGTVTGSNLVVRR
jgi:hypothetical protein